MIRAHLKESGKSLLLNINYVVSVSGNRLVDFAENIYEVEEDFEELEQIIKAEEDRCLKQDQ